MSRLPDSPLDEPAPPPLEMRFPSRLSWMVICAVIGLVGIVSLVRAPYFLRRAGKCGPGQSEVVNNARQIGIALFEFEIHFGSFPDPSTIAEVRRQTGTLLPLGTKTSNDFFRQLLASGISQSEAMFYAKIQGVRKPDGLFDGAHALSKGECGYTYFLGTPKVTNPNRPLLVSPMIPGTDRFDPKPFDGKMVILRMDNSVTSLPIDKHGHVVIAGRNLMDPHHPIWEGHAPVIAWPDL